MAQSKYWCFTLNNPTDEEKGKIADVLTDAAQAVYGVVGREVGANGTPHLQGYVILPTRRRLGYLRRVFSARGHYEVARGTPQQNRDYCKKDGDSDEYGNIPLVTQGRRSDLESVFEWASEFEAENGRPPRSPDLARKFPVVYTKYPRIRHTIDLRAEPVRLEFGEELKEWQTWLENELLTPPDDRTVQFIVDEEGNRGKSWFCRYFLSKYPEKAQMLGVGKRDDITHMVCEDKNVFFFNVPRGCMEYFQYPVLEMLKDRMVVSPKYASRVKVMREKCHVIVMCNEPPDCSKMSADRYLIKNLN